MRTLNVRRAGIPQRAQRSAGGCVLQAELIGQQHSAERGKRRAASAGSAGYDARHAGLGRVTAVVWKVWRQRGCPAQNTRTKRLQGSLPVQVARKHNPGERSSGNVICPAGLVARGGWSAEKALRQ